MTAETEGMPQATVHPTRPYYWSVRRELWEHPSIVVAPLVIGAVALLGSIMSTVFLPGVLRQVAAGNLQHAGGIMGPYSFEAISVMLTGSIVAVFYAQGALHSERRDRSVLFWKSLPVSDLTTVMAKATVPIVITPIAVFAIIAATQLLMLLWSTLVVAANGLSLALFFKHVNLTTMLVALPYGLVVNALWTAPVFAWLILVSGWARRTPFLWATAPFAIPALFELAFRTSHIAKFIGERLFGGFAAAYGGQGQRLASVKNISQLDPLRVLAMPGLWLGLIAAALLLAAAVLAAPSP